MTKKIYLCVDKNYNRPYYKVIGTIEELAKNQTMFLFKFNRWISKPVIKEYRNWKLEKQTIQYMQWYQEEQECLFKVVDANNKDYYIVELYDNAK